MKKFSLVFLTAFAFLSLLLTTKELPAQDRKYPARTTDLSDEDWTAWRAGVETAETADKAYINKDYTAAAALYRKTLDLFRKVRKSNPYWNRNGLIYRITILERKLAAAERKQTAHSARPAEFPGKLSVKQQIAAANADSVAEIAALKTALTDSRNRCADLQTELKRAALTAKQVEGLLAEKAEMEKKYSMLLIQYNDLHNQVRSGKPDTALVSALENEKKRTEAFRKELDGFQQDFRALQTRLAQANIEKNALEQTNTQLEKRLAASSGNELLIEKLRADVDESKARASAETAKIRAECNRLSAELAKKSRQTDEMREKLTKLRASMNLDEAARHLEQEAAGLRAENIALHREISTINERLTEQTGKANLASGAEKSAKNLAANLNERVNRLSSALETAHKLCTKLQSDGRKSEIELATVQKENIRLRTERDAIAKNLSRIPGKTSIETAAALAKAKADLESAIAGRDKLSAELKQNIIDGEASAKQIAEQKTALKNASGKIEKLEQKLRESASLDQTMKKALAREMTLKKELSAATAKIASLKEVESKFSVSENTRSALEKKLSAAAKETAELKKFIKSQQYKQRAELTAEIEKLKAASASDGKKIEVLTAKANRCDCLAEETRALRTSLLQLETGKNNLEKENLVLKKSIDYHKRRAKEYDKIITNESLLKSTLMENKILKTEIAQVRAQKVDPVTKRELEYAKLEIKKIHREYDRNLNEIARLKAKTMEFKIHIAELEKQIETLRTKNAELKKVPAVITRPRAEQLSDEEKKLLEARAVDAEKKVRLLEEKLKFAGQKLKSVAKSAPVANSASVAAGVSLVEFEKLRDANARLNESIRKLNEDKARSGESLIAVRHELLSVKALLEKARADIAADVRGKALEASLKQVSQQAEKWEADCKKAQAGLEQTTREKNALSQKNNGLEKQLEDASEKTLRLQNEVRKWSAGTESVIREKTAEKDRVIDRILQEHVALKKEIDLLGAKLAKARTDAAAAQKEAKDLRAALEQAKTSGKKHPSGVKIPETTIITTGNRVAAERNDKGGIVIYTTTAGGKKVCTDNSRKSGKTLPKRKLTPAREKTYRDAMSEAAKFEKNNDPDQALWKYLVASDADPGAFQPHLAIARIYLKAGEKTQAIQEYEKAIALGAADDPDLEEIRRTGNTGKNN